MKKKSSNNFTTKAICAFVFLLGLNCLSSEEYKETGEVIFNACTGLLLMTASIYVLYKACIKPNNNKSIER